MKSILKAASEDIFGANYALDPGAKIQDSHNLNTRFDQFVGDFSTEVIAELNKYEKVDDEFHFVLVSVRRHFDIYKDTLADKTYLARLLNSSRRYIYYLFFTPVKKCLQVLLYLCKMSQVTKAIQITVPSLLFSFFVSL